MESELKIAEKQLVSRKSTSSVTSAASSIGSVSAGAAGPTCYWSAHTHNGKPYYYNKLTQKSTWTKPVELIEFERQRLARSRSRTLGAPPSAPRSRSVDRPLHSTSDSISSVTTARVINQTPSVPPAPMRPSRQARQTLETLQEAPSRQRSASAEPALRGEHNPASAEQKKTLATRAKVIREIKISERVYVESLGILVRCYLEPFRSSKRRVLSQEEVRVLFSNVEQILGFHKQFLEALERTPPELIYQPFQHMSDFLKLYTTYVNGYDAASKLVAKYADNSRFHKVLEKAQADSGTHLGIMAYLIMPVQRIPRYVLLLKEVLKHTPALSETNMIQSLKSSLAKVQSVANHVNEAKRAVDNRMHMLAIKHKIGKTAPSGLQIVSPGRLVEHEGACKELKSKSKHVKPRLLVVFSDMILWATDPGYKYKGHFFIQDIEVTRVLITKVEGTDTKLQGFRVKNRKKNESVLFFSETEGDADGWVKTIRNAISPSRGTDAKGSNAASPGKRLKPRRPRPPPPPRPAKPAYRDSASVASDGSSLLGVEPRHRQHIKSIWGGTDQLGMYRN